MQIPKWQLPWKQVCLDSGEMKQVKAVLEAAEEIVLIQTAREVPCYTATREA